MRTSAAPGLTWNGDVTLTGERVTNDSSGFFGGAQMGYNQQIGNIIIGVETTLSGSIRSVVDPAQFYDTDISTIVTVTGRLGVGGDQWMLTPWGDGRVRQSTSWDATQLRSIGFPPTIGAAVGLSEQASRLKSRATLALA